MNRDFAAILSWFSSLHFGQTVAVGQAKPEMLQEVSSGFVRLFDSADAKRGAAALLADWNDHVHRAYLAELVDELAGAGSQPFGGHPHLEAAPHGKGDEADEDVGFDAVGLLV